MSLRKRRRGGSVMVEFTLVGIPLIFVLISVFEVARGMWIYHTLAYAIKEGTRYAIVHGHNCDLDPNTCETTVQDVVGRIKDAAVGLLPDDFNIRLWYGVPTSTCGADCVPCEPLGTSGCLANTNRWPEYPKNQPSMDISITGTYRFRSAISMFWPGAGRGMNFGTFDLPASSTESIQF